MYRIIHSFLLALAAVVAVSLLVAPQPAWTTTEAAPPLAVTPPGPSAPLGGGGGIGPGSLCGATVTTTDLDPECFRDCEVEWRRCRNAARDRYENRRCSEEHAMCEVKCLAGDADPDNPWFGDRNPWPGSGAEEECETPADPGCGNLRNHLGPSEDTDPLDGAESPRRRPHLF